LIAICSLFAPTAAEPLVVVPLKLAADIAAAAEQGKRGNP
jgi:hypothetical protein